MLPISANCWQLKNISAEIRGRQHDMHRPKHFLELGRVPDAAHEVPGVDYSLDYYKHIYMYSTLSALAIFTVARFRGWIRFR